MPRWKKYSLIAAGTICSILLLSMLVVPWQIKKQGSAWVAENTTRQLQIESAFFNPFTLTVEVEGVKLTEAGSEKTFVSLQRLMLSASVRSIIDLALILDRVELDAPYLNIELLGKQEFNFSDFTRLGGDQQEPASAEPSQPFQFSFNNIVLTDGEIDFTDQTSPKKSQHQIRELSLAVPFVGNVPYLTDDYVEPHLRMRLNGSELRANGQLKPFHHSLETSLSLMLTEVELPFYAFHSPVPLPVEVKSGSLDAQIDLTYRVSDSEIPQLLLSGELALSDIDIRDPNGENLFLLPTLILDVKQARLLEQNVHLTSLDIYQPQLFVNRDKQGLVNLLKLVPGKTEPSPALSSEESTTSSAELPLLKADLIALHEGQIHYHDKYVTGEFQETVQGINLQLDKLSSHPGELTQFAFDFQTTRQSEFSLIGHIGLNPLSADLALLLNGLQLAPHYPFLSELLTQAPAGQLNLATHIKLGPEISLQLSQMQFGLHQLSIPFTDQDHFKLQDLNISGGSFDLETQLLRIGNIQLNNGNVIARRNRDGSLSPLELLRKQTSNEPPRVKVETKTATAMTLDLPWQKNTMQIDPNAFKIKLETFVLDQFDLQFTDEALTKKPQLNIQQLEVKLDNLAYPESERSPFKVAAKIDKGQLDFSGHVMHTPLNLQAQANIKALPLTLANDFLPDNVKVSLKSGKFTTDIAVKLTEQPEQLIGSFSGRMNISNFNLRDPFDNGELLTWGRLNLEGISGQIFPFKLRIKELAMSDYLAKIQIDKQGQINLANITTAAEDEAEPPAEEEITTIENEESTPPTDIRIDAVTLQGGTVSFTDRHLPDTFTTTMYQLGGRVTGLSSDEEMQADVDLRGQLKNHSPLTINGQINPLSKKLYANLTIRFHDIDLVPMTPYSGTFVGYAINKGKLYLDLTYHIENRKVTAENKVLIDQFTFGDSIKSDQATSLPVGLAIALLKDSSGEIHLDLPVSGDLDDPEFGIASTIFTILKNLVVKAATSPFALLGSMLGGDEDFSSVSFAAGSDQLSSEQQQKLAKLAEMLIQRPALTLGISAFADREKDPEAYRRRQIHQLMLEAKAIDLVEGGQDVDLDEINISEEEYPKYLLQIYEDAEFPRPRNFVGMLKSLPVSEMEKLLLANIHADDEQMRRLASNRAMTVRDSLFMTSSEVKKQVFLSNVDIYKPTDKGVNSRVEFTISSK